MKIIACLASTLDGKIASHHNPESRFGSAEDLTHLQTVRNQADAILCGGETFRQYSKVRQGNRQDKPPWQCILTKSLHLPPQAGVFHQKETHGRVIVFSPKKPDQAIKRMYPQHIQWQSICSNNTVLSLLESLEQRHVKTLLIEGGGEVLSLFMEHQQLHEFYLTLCPLFLGGTSSPSLLSGHGFSIKNAPRTTLIKQEVHNNELFLHLKLSYSPA